VVFWGGGWGLNILHIYYEIYCIVHCTKHCKPAHTTHSICITTLNCDGNNVTAVQVRLKNGPSQGNIDLCMFKKIKCITFSTGTDDFKIFDWPSVSVNIFLAAMKKLTLFTIILKLKHLFRKY
jgi:hypothetical protein